MAESILDSIKKMLGVSPDDTSFDTDITIHINSQLANLHQLGVGPVEGFRIESKAETWDQLLGDDPRVDNVKTWLYMKVKMVFDPPTTQALVNSWEKVIQEYEFRINTRREETSWVDPTTPLVVP